MMNDNEYRKTIKSLFRELPYFGVNHFVPLHGQFNNLNISFLPTKKYLEKLSSFRDLDLFNLNTASSINPDQNLVDLKIHSRYFSPHSFYTKINRSHYTDDLFSLFHANVRSLKRNFENLQTHLLSELGYPFNIIGISETKITESDQPDYHPTIPAPTPLASGGVGMFIDENFKYRVLEKISSRAFQALWVELQFERTSNIICGVIYRQHNSPESFQAYFDETLEKLSNSDKPIYVLGDFNINLLNAESCNFTKDFLLSLQSYSFIPTIDKPTRVSSNSATLIDNIFVNQIGSEITSGNIISDISDHFSQFCIIKSLKAKELPKKFSRDTDENIHSELSEINWDLTMANCRDNADAAFSKFFNSLNKIINKHAPLRPLSKHKAKQFSKPWISRGAT